MKIAVSTNRYKIVMSETIICTLKPREILWYLAGGAICNGAGEDKIFPVKCSLQKTGDEVDSRVKYHLNVQTN